jgi:hypothetical protein
MREVVGTARRWDLGEMERGFSKWLALPSDFGNPKRHRLFSPSRVFWLFLTQVLSADRTCREVVRGFLLWLAAATGRTASPNTAGYCQARSRLRLSWIEEVARALGAKLSAAERPAMRWHGRRVKVVDGTGLSMPDTPENQAVYPQSKRQKAGCGFPTMKVVGLFSLASGAFLALAKGCLDVSERALFRTLWPHLESGDVVLADCGFCGYAEFHCLREQGVHSVMRNHQRRKVGLSLVRRLGPGDRLVAWHKARLGPKWMSREAWRAIPDRLTVREIHFSVAIPGFRTKSVTLVTTLVNVKRFSKQDFMDLYRRRWQVELSLRDIKTTMGMDELRCLTPDMVHKELVMYEIAYNLVRALMLEAARPSDVPLERLSFKGSVVAVRQWAPVLATAHLSAKRRRQMIAALLDSIARDLNPDRPNRTEPRAVKRRPKNYQRLTGHRRTFREAPHRNHYRKSLS